LTGTAERCSARSLALEEPQVGTASTVRNWILLEQAGPWGTHALTESRLPPELGEELRRRSHEFGVRVVLIRRHGRSTTPGAQSFVCHSGPDAPWLELARLERPSRVLDLDFGRLAQGRPLGLEPVEGPLFVVCTHGRRDPCCAERGRPLAAALAPSFGERVWESSHIGGDRFAGNLVCFPHGAYFGRVAARDALGVAGAYQEGRIDLPHYRGRSCYEFAVQAAEIFLRNETGRLGIDELRLVGRGWRDGVVTARFSTPSDETLSVRLRVSSAEHARPLTCKTRRASHPPRFELVDILT
jgi:hypothetical protein